MSARSKLLGAKREFKRKLVVTESPSGEEMQVEIKQPTIREGGMIRNKALQFKAGEDAVFKTDEYAIWAVITLCYEVGTDERVFSDADYDTIRDSPSCKWYDDISKECQKFTNVGSDEEVSEKKPSSETQPES